MLEKIKINKLKIITLISIVAFFFMLLNTKNIYNLLKGETLNFNNDYNIKMVLEGHETNNVTNITTFEFTDKNSNDAIPIFKYTKEKTPEVYSATITMNFQANNISKKARLTLAPGIYLVNDGSKTFGTISNSKENMLISCSHTNKTQLQYYNISTAKDEDATDAYDNLFRNDGIVEYVLNPKGTTFSFTVQLSLDPAFDFSTIENAITIELVEGYNDELQTAPILSKSITLDYSEIPITVNGSSNINTYGALNSTTDTNPLGSYNLTDNLVGIKSYQSGVRTVFYNYIQFFVEVPSDTYLLNTRRDGLNVDTVGYEYKGEPLTLTSGTDKLDIESMKIQNGIINEYLLNDEIFKKDSVKDNTIKSIGLTKYNTTPKFGIPNTYINVIKDGDRKIYVFTAKYIYFNSFGVIPVWAFYGAKEMEFIKSNKKEIASGVQVKGLKVKYQVYGGTHNEIMLNREEIEDGETKIKDSSINKFEIINHEIISNGYSKGNVFSYDADYPNDEVHLGSYKFYNKSPIPSKAKDITFKFDPDIAVSSIVVPLLGNGKNSNGTYGNLTVSYKKKYFDGENWINQSEDDSYSDTTITIGNDFSSSSLGSKYDLFLLTKELLGLKENEYITELILRNLTIPEYYETKASDYYNSYYGKVINDKEPVKKLYFSIKNHNSEKTETDEGFATDNIKETLKSVDKENQIRVLTAAPAYVKGNPDTINSVGLQRFSFEIYETIEKSSNLFRKTYNPIIYVRSETGLQLKNFTLKSLKKEAGIKNGLVNEIDITNEIIITSYSEDSTKNNLKPCVIGEVCIYKIDTSRISKDKAVVGIGSHFYNRNKKYIDYRLLLNFDMDVPIEYSSQKSKYKYNDMIFVTDQKSNDVRVYTIQNQKGDPFDVDLDGNKKGTNNSEGVYLGDAMSYLNIQNFYQIALSKELNSIIKQKNSNEKEYKVWKDDNGNISLAQDKTLDLRLQLQNNSGKKMEVNNENDDAFLYIPIPKKGENWGQLSGDETTGNKAFNLSLELLDYLSVASKEDITYQIYYGLQGDVIPKKDNNTLKETDLSTLIKEEDLSKDLLKKVNFIVIKILGLEKDKTISIDFKLGLKNEEYKEIFKQQFRYSLYRNLITSDNQERAGFLTGNTVGVTNELSKYKLDVIHKDIYDNILDTESYIKTYGEAYETSKKEFENHEIFLEPENAKGIIKEDTTVTYVYKSILNRKVIVHYYEKGTKNKLLEDKVLTGKDLEGFVIKPEVINGYKVTDNKEIKGSFKEDTQEFIYEYEKEIIVIPSTLDNVISSIIIFAVSIISMVLIIIYVRRKKKQK